MSEKPLDVTPDALLTGKEHPDVVEVPARVVLAITGEGEPGDHGFSAAIAALYGVSYALRFGRKKAGRSAFKVGVLEGEWRAEGAGLSIHEAPSQGAWRWRMQMGVPPDVTAEELREVVNAVTTKPGGKLEGSEEAARIELLRLGHDRFARILHVGPYSTEPESFSRIAELLSERGLHREPWHLEVYLSDPSRTVPEKLKTVLLTRVK